MKTKMALQFLKNVLVSYAINISLSALRLFQVWGLRDGAILRGA
jgi:hypothetical protein